MSDWSGFGFTTGMAAAAAAIAAAELIREGTYLENVSLQTPRGDRRLTIEIDCVQPTESGATARVTKRAGPDRDITDGLVIEAAVESRSHGYVTIEGGEGVGRVTLPGLAVPVGSPAINPVPRKHITQLLGARLSEGAEVTISAIGGDAKAEKTFNPRLGIVGGVSILGTTGLVRPMSMKAWRAALLIQLDQAVALGHSKIALTPGNLGAVAAGSLGVPGTAIAQMGNFVGHILRQAVHRELRPLIVGHLGKVVKIAAGYEDTHHKRTRDRLVLLSELVGESDADMAERVMGLNSAEAAIGALQRVSGLLDTIAGRAAAQAGRMAGREVGVVITDLSGRSVGIEPTAATMLGDVW